jgi:4'-phosphopantetheinyl transferase
MAKPNIQTHSSISTWSLPPDVLELESHQVDIWRIRFDIPTNLLKVLEEKLSVDESERAGRFHFQIHRDRFIAAHGCLREILTRYLHCDPHQISFSINPYGKPALVDHNLEFNLSHSGDFALIAITDGRRVGIDIEQIRQGISSQVIAQQYFSKAEVAELQALPLEQRKNAFFTCWTRKEAYIKAHGLGLSLPLESFDVSLSPSEPAMLRATRPDPHEAARWTLLSLEVDPRYGSAVAVEGVALSAEGVSKGQDMEFRLWDWKLL